MYQYLCIEGKLTLLMYTQKYKESIEEIFKRYEGLIYTNSNNIKRQT